MFEKCLSCPKFGTASCNMTKLFSLPSGELLKLCKKQKKKLHLSNADIAEGSGTPKGTLDRLFAEDDFVDFKYETIRRIVIFLFGGGTDEELCIDPAVEVSSVEKVRHYEEEIKQLQRQLDVKDKQIDAQSELLKERRDFLRLKDAEISELKKERKGFRIATIALALLLAVALVYTTFTLVVDYRNPYRGFWWMEDGVIGAELQD